MEERIIRLLEEYEEEGEFDENIYSQESRLHMLEDGEISADEQGFMEGYEEAI